MPGTALSSDSRNLSVEEAKHSFYPSLSSTCGGCVFLNDPNSAHCDDHETFRTVMRHNTVAQLHRHHGPQRVAMAHALGKLEKLTKQVLLCEVEEGEDEMLNLEQWVDTEIELTLDSGCCFPHGIGWVEARPTLRRWERPTNAK